MIRCKHVADALAEVNYEELPMLKKLGVRLHVALCLICGRFHRQLIKMQQGEKRFLRQEDRLDTVEGPALPDDAKERIQARLQAETRNH